MESGFEAKPPRGKRSRAKLKTAFDVQMLQAKAVRQLLNNEVSTEKFRALTYGLDLMLKAIKTANLEERLSQIEQALSEKEAY